MLLLFLLTVLTSFFDILKLTLYLLGADHGFFICDALNVFHVWNNVVYHTNMLRLSELK